MINEFLAVIMLSLVILIILLGILYGRYERKKIHIIEKFLGIKELNKKIIY